MANEIKNYKSFIDENGRWVIEFSKEDIEKIVQDYLDKEFKNEDIHRKEKAKEISVIYLQRIYKS